MQHRLRFHGRHTASQHISPAVSSYFICWLRLWLLLRLRMYECCHGCVRACLDVCEISVAENIGACLACTLLALVSSEVRYHGDTILVARVTVKMNKVLARWRCSMCAKSYFLRGTRHYGVICVHCLVVLTPMSVLHADSCPAEKRSNKGRSHERSCQENAKNCKHIS